MRRERSDRNLEPGKSTQQKGSTSEASIYFRVRAARQIQESMPEGCGGSEATGIWSQERAHNKKEA
ncbi:Uncharacterised protein [uncultured Clostridium sp.]|nr:Uncharacterised protein [uncultured Clostridium sp.]